MEYVFRDSKLVLSMEKKEFNYIKDLDKAKRNFCFATKFITFDIETRTIDNIMSPYCICFYDGFHKYSFYLSEFNDSNEMIKKALRSILTNKKYNNSLVFAHSFSKFDNTFILKNLVLIAIELNLKISIIKRDSEFINISVFSESTGFNINFRDSLLLLPSSLRKLAKSFSWYQPKGGVKDKSIFPYNFFNNPGIDLNYSGTVPDFKYFSDITLQEYNAYSSKFTKKWYLKYETIKYCLQDCVSLYQVLKKFSNTIYKDLKVNLKFAPTTSSLALRTFLLLPYVAKNKIQGCNWY